MCVKSELPNFNSKLPSTYFRRLSCWVTLVQYCFESCIFSTAHLPTNTPECTFTHVFVLNALCLLKYAIRWWSFLSEVTCYLSNFYYVSVTNIDRATFMSWNTTQVAQNEILDLFYCKQWKLHTSESCTKFRNTIFLRLYMRLYLYIRHSILL